MIASSALCLSLCGLYTIEEPKYNTRFAAFFGHGTKREQSRDEHHSPKPSGYFAENFLNHKYPLWAS